MTVGHMEDPQQITAEGKQVESIEEFSSAISAAWLATTAAVTKTPESELRKQTQYLADSITSGKAKLFLNTKIKIRLYESLVMLTLLYAAETWPMTVANMKKTGGGSP